MTQALSRRERKRAETRRSLIEATRRRIIDDGLTAFRVSDLTQDVDVAQGTFYLHFSSKDDVVEAVVAELIDPIAERAFANYQSSHDPALAVAVGVKELALLGTTTSEWSRLFLRLEGAQERFTRIIWDRCEPVILDGLRSGRFGGTADASLMLHALIAGVFAAIRAGEGSDPDVAARSVVTLGLQMLGVDTADAQTLYEAAPQD